MLPGFKMKLDIIYDLVNVMQTNALWVYKPTLSCFIICDDVRSSISNVNNKH